MLAIRRTKLWQIRRFSTSIQDLKIDMEELQKFNPKLAQ